MSEREQQIAQINPSIEEAEKRIEDAAALDRLYKNKDFRHVFLDGYFMKEASRTVLLKADPNMQGDEEQRDCNNIIMAIGMLRQHFAKVFGLGSQAEKAVADDKEARQQLMEEASGIEVLNDGLPVIEGEAVQ